MYMRNPNAVVVGRDKGAILFAPDGSSLFFAAEQAPLVCRLMTLLTDPKSPQQAARELQVPLADLDPLLTSLHKRNVLVRDAPERLKGFFPTRYASQKVCKKLVFGICGTVQAAAVLPTLVIAKDMLAEEVEVVLTDGAERFVNPRAFEYFGCRVWQDVYEVRGDINVPHMYLASHADLVVVVPTSAHLIQRIATGSCADLLSLVVVATRAPVVLAPSMNIAMRDFFAVRKNVEQLRAGGIHVVEPALAFEVSKHFASEPSSFCAPGISMTNVVKTLSAVLLAHRELQRDGDVNSDAVAVKIDNL